MVRMTIAPAARMYSISVSDLTMHPQLANKTRHKLGVGTMRGSTVLINRSHLSRPCYGLKGLAFLSPLAVTR